MRLLACYGVQMPRFQVAVTSFECGWSSFGGCQRDCFLLQHGLQQMLTCGCQLHAPIGLLECLFQMTLCSLLICLVVVQTVCVSRVTSISSVSQQEDGLQVRTGACDSATEGALMVIGLTVRENAWLHVFRVLRV